MGVRDFPSWIGKRKIDDISGHAVLLLVLQEHVGAKLFPVDCSVAVGVHLWQIEHLNKDWFHLHWIEMDRLDESFLIDYDTLL